MFEEIHGNKTSLGLLEAMLQKRELIPRGIVLEGPSGCGKSLIAKKFLESLTSSSVLTISPTKFDTISSLEDLYSSCIIFDNCHLLTKEQWLTLSQILDASKFLGYFVFITPEPQKLPPVIKSRVFRISISRLSEEDSLNYLLNLCAVHQKDYQLGALKELARKTKGTPSEMNTLFKVCTSLGGVTKDNLERCSCSDLEDISIKLLLSLGEPEQSFALLERLLDNHSPKEIIDQLFTTYSKAVLYKNQPVWRTIYSRYPDFHKKTHIFLNWLKAESLPGDSLYLMVKELSEEEAPEIPQKVSHYQELSGPSTVGVKALVAAINGRIEKE